MSVSLKQKVIRTIGESNGTLTAEDGLSVNVRFTMTQWQEYLDGLPSLKHARGSLEFFNTADAWKMTVQGQKVTLRGAGIEAQVLCTSMDSYVVTGPVADV